MKVQVVQLVFSNKVVKARDENYELFLFNVMKLDYN